MKKIDRRLKVMETEFNLSNFIEDDDDIKNGKINSKAVKEFIRLCEDNSEEINGKSYIKISTMQRFAGDKLK
jgi:hypothetical protein